MQLGGAQECLYLSHEENDNVILKAIGEPVKQKQRDIAFLKAKT